ncbi:YeiH family protein [Nonomuraea sp. WAC 01424]|uniref:YeiH family protein n=1 Tax=Nonomuraea sp. WAC 01424 TaxID=2203200 RepID=UPI00163B79DB|nr:putative sulfate exporter family transporter [Nonomuraea sp. WAC 01424]
MPLPDQRLSPSVPVPVPGEPPVPVRQASVWPGIGLAAVAVVVAMVVNRFVPAFSPAVIAVLSGAVLANLVAVAASSSGPAGADRAGADNAGAGRAGVVWERFRPGLAFVSKRVLRVAIALLGLQIAMPQVLALGWQTLVIVVAATGVTFAVTPLIGRRLGLSPGTSLLVATGVSICGAAAVAAMRESADGTDDDDAAAALSVVVLYGSAAIVAVPALPVLLGLSPAQLGVWTGAAVHEVAQVAAIGAASGVLAAAVTVKLARVILLAPLVALTAVRARRPDTAEQTRREGRRPPVMPLFVAAFLVMVAVRSTGWVPEPVTEAVPQVTNVLMAAALFGLGTGIDVRKLIKGGRAVLLGAIATGLIAAVSLTGVAVLL